MCVKLFKLRFNTSIQEIWEVSSFSQKNVIAFLISKDQGKKLAQYKNETSMLKKKIILNKIALLTNETIKLKKKNSIN